MKPFFVILQTGEPFVFAPMVDPDGGFYQFATVTEAEVAARNTHFGHTYGFKVFSWFNEVPLAMPRPAMTEGRA